MSIEENKAIIRRWLEEGWTNGNLSVADELIDPDFIAHVAGGQAVPSGPDGVRQIVTAWRTGFPDGRMVIDDLIGVADKVVIRMTWRGTHQGDFYGIAPTNRQVSVTSIGIDRVVNGKIVEGWGEVDMLGMYQQLGVIAAPGSAT
ncbi:MAG TPA: ester cyclase [Candidatus Competibacter sp.]|jgi:predicted ester cyclase|nr:ester cyclase [Candidatus Competibacter sp.]HRF62642.1 ester cyclase [Candidatus Competibacter sp.]HRX61274.1 ester cyclase [Candidatus Competibacter sp.]HUM90362.1 ester cyclase [Candidatus Competibacter sp.]